MTTVWVVEDDPDIAEGCQLALENAGFAVHLCRSGQEALAWIETQPAFDVVILDLHLPGVGGEAVLSAIQNQWKKAKVFVATADHLLAGILASQPQVCEALVKPVGLKALVELIRRYTSD